jgi:hypothetical protein
MVWRRIKGSLGHVDGHMERVGKETKKVLRIASRDLMDKSGGRWGLRGKR